MKKNIVHTDKNLLFDFFEDEETSFYSIDISIKPVDRTKEANLMTIYTYVIMDNYEFVFYRSYKKLDEILANIMSLFSFILFIIKMFYEIFNFGFLEYKIGKKL